MSVQDEIAKWERFPDKSDRATYGDGWVDAVLSSAFEDRLRTADAVLEALVDRVKRNGGLGEYAGGKAFALGDARAYLAAREKER